MRPNPLVYEINARVLLAQLDGRHGRAVRLSTVPDELWRSLADAGFDMVWLMGVWTRSSISRRIALRDDGLRRSFDRALPDREPRDVAGSPYAIRSYSLDPALGHHDELGALRSKLNSLGLGLVVDFVAGHLARDHPWMKSHPDRFVQASPDVARRHPDRYFTAHRRRFAHGRDPNFGPWTDTVQTNLFRADARQSLIEELLRIADVADGVRCDMAMLALNDVFEPLWRDCVQTCPRPDREFWRDAVEAARARHPQFVFLAEAYWGLEPTLLDLGFDFAYDKTLYDRLRHSDVPSLRRHLTTELASSGRGAHFIENHDEERAVTAFGARRSMAAAAVALTVPGLRLVHDGQLEGRKARLPVQLVRAPEEAPDPQVRGFYDKLLAVLRMAVCREGVWSLLEVEPAPAGSHSHQPLMAFIWQRDRERLIIVVNYADAPSDGILRLDRSERLVQESLSGRLVADPRRSPETDRIHLSLNPWEVCVLSDSPHQSRR